MAVEFRAFGPIEVRDGDRPVDVGGRMERAILAVLLVHANRVVSADRLIDHLWAGDPPGAAESGLHAYVSHVRRVLEPDRRPRTPATVLLTQAPGYLLRVEPDAFDVARFESLADAGRAALAAGRLAEARDLLARARALWQGPPYAELASEVWMLPEVTRLGERRLAAEEALAEARLALGEHPVAVDELERLVAEEPLRERAWELLALALYRCGRQADALRALARIRGLLAEELGLEPRPSLRRLEDDILRHAPGLELHPPGPPAEGDGPPAEGDSYLEIWSDRGRHVVDLGAERVTIGRSSGSTVQVPDATVSRTHAVIERGGHGWSVRDAGSANGTFVNERAVTADPLPLQPGDEIVVGGTHLFLRSRAMDAAAETAGVDPGARRQPARGG